MSAKEELLKIIPWLRPRVDVKAMERAEAERVAFYKGKALHQCPTCLRTIGHPPPCYRCVPPGDQP